MIIPVYNIGDRVRIVRYGQLMFAPNNKFYSRLKFPIIAKDDETIVFDWRSDLIGGDGIIANISTTQDIPTYSIQGIGAWFNEDQLELVINNH